MRSSMCWLTGSEDGWSEGVGTGGGEGTVLEAGIWVSSEAGGAPVCPESAGGGGLAFGQVFR